MSDENETPTTRRDLADELPRSAVSGRRPPRLAAPSDSAPLRWALLALLAMVAFAAMLWILREPDGRPIPAADGVIAPATSLR
jgi:hypothetical protein